MENMTKQPQDTHEVENPRYRIGPDGKLYIVEITMDAPQFAPGGGAVEYRMTLSIYADPRRVNPL
jgi:hypothetical protein